MSSIASTPSTGLKRAFQSDDRSAAEPIIDSTSSKSPPQTASAVTSAFRNVSACNRCRVRKNRCDQKLPTCSTCEKAHVRCVGYDPITKREIPRSYVFFLETRIAYFESLLTKHGVVFEPAKVYNADSKELGDGTLTLKGTGSPVVVTESPRVDIPRMGRDQDWEKKEADAEKLNKLVSNIGMVSVEGASDARYLGSTSGISFARVVLAAIKSSVSTNNSERNGPKSSRTLPEASIPTASSMRDSYFGLQTKPTFNEAPFPDRSLGEKLVNLYFEHANPQIPILHRGEFMNLFDHAYSVDPPRRSARELYFLNIVFAVGAGIIWGSSDSGPEPIQQTEHALKKPRLVGQQAQPEEYHASAIVNLGSFLSTVEVGERNGGDLEELQAVLLLAAFALLRPVAPGLWYIIGVAMRLAVDLGLHYEDGSEIGGNTASNRISPRIEDAHVDKREKGRREWVRDLRRRLWWCTYNFDRLVSTCVGRPFGITDSVVTTDFPSLLEDKYITRSGFLKQALDNEPSYKRAAHHYFRLRLLQSEILQVLQYQQAQQARQSASNHNNEFMHAKIPSPFLSRFESFRDWRMDIDQRLYEWKESAPTQRDTGVAFSTQFLELNYWQAVIMLYRQSLSVPAPFASELSPTEEVSSPSGTRIEEKEDEDRVFLKCAEAGQKTLKLYRQLHRQRLVNYTYLATHHLFMAGISFLYAVWHSPAVRKRLTLDDFDFTVLAATSVLGDLMEKCPPAEACRDAFERMSKATVQMCMTSPGFGSWREQSIESQPLAPQQQIRQSMSVPMDLDSETRYELDQDVPYQINKSKRPPPQFDMDLRGLFPDDLDSSMRPSQSFPRSLLVKQQQQQQPSMSHARQQSSSLLRHQPHSPMSSIASQLNTASIYPPSPTLQRQNSSQYNQPLYMQNSYNPDFMSIPGMDFLNSLANTSHIHSTTTPLTDHISPNAAAVSPPGPNTTISPMTSEYNNNNNNQDNNTYAFSFDSSGLDLGFGIGATSGLDFQHDWSDGGQLDLFDGFFFGNNGMSS